MGNAKTGPDYAGNLENSLVNDSNETQHSLHSLRIDVCLYSLQSATTLSDISGSLNDLTVRCHLE